MKLLITNVAFLLFGISLCAQSPMAVPPLLNGSTFELDLQTGITEFYDGIETNTMGMNGPLLGPTLEFVQGQNVSITITNNLGEPTTIHWHGMHVPAEDDGGPHSVIDTDGVWNPDFEVLDHAATYWYHPHLHENTNRHVLNGIAGFVIVRDDQESSLDLPRTYAVDDFPLVFQTKGFDNDGQIVVDTEMDTAVMANGVVNAYLDLPAQVVRLRCLDGASQRSFNIARSDGGIFHVIGGDGGLLEAPVSMTGMLISPGERSEILLDLSGMEGQSFDIVNKGSLISNNIHGSASVVMGPGSIPGYDDNPLNGEDFTLLHINVVDQTANPVTSIPDELIVSEALLETSADLTRNFTLSPEVMGPVGMVNGPFVINGQAYDMDVVNHTIPLDNIEIWSIFNQTGVAHPFHIHDTQFYILDKDGVIPPTHERGRKDVVLVESMETVRFITQFSDHADEDIPYMYHCHMLPHEDAGMMGQFLVVDNPDDIDSIHESANPMIYPIPSRSGYLFIEMPAGNNWTLDVISADGRMVKQLTGIASGLFQLDAKELQGSGIIRIYNDEHMFTRHVIME